MFSRYKMQCDGIVQLIFNLLLFVIFFYLSYDHISRYVNEK